MGWLDKITKNKTSVILGIATTALAVGVGFLYKNYAEKNAENQQNIQENTLEAQIAKLKQQVGPNPSLQSLKKVLKLSVQYARDAVFDYSKEFKKKCRSFDRQSRKNNLQKYLRVALQGMNEIQLIGVRTQQQLMHKIGISQRDLSRYQNELGEYMQQQMMILMQPKVSGQQFSLEDVKKAVKKQTIYLQQNAQDLGTRIVHATSGWSLQQKMLLPSLLSVIISDEVFDDQQNFDQDQLQAVQLKYQSQLGAEMMELQQAMQPLIMALSGQMGGMGGMDMMGGVTPQQLQQLQMQDPEAFAQLMAMIQQ